MTTRPLSAAPANSGGAVGRFTVGTLRYTSGGLAVLFIWLIWGELFWTVLDQNLPTILPLKLRELGSPDTLNAILNRSIAYAIIFVLAPIVSMWSDRHRGRYGRRIPFLVGSTPFVGLFLILIGCYGDLTGLVTGGADSAIILGVTLSADSVSIGILAILMIGFDCANIFANTIYYYLFNDVVPQAFMARFMSLFRMVGIVSGMIYSRWLLPHAMEHFRLIFVVAGIAMVFPFGIRFLAQSCGRPSLNRRR